MITGGCIVSMLLKERVNDFDIYFRNKETALAVANYYVAEFLNHNEVTFAGHEKKQVAIEVIDQPERVYVSIKSAGIAGDQGSEKYQYFESVSDRAGEEYTDDAMKQVAELDDKSAEALEAEEVYKPVFLSSNAITLSGRVQLIVRFYGEPEEIHKNYDYVHCTCYWKSWDDAVVTPSDALAAILTRELRYVGSKYPLCSIIRIRKFVARGWTINAGQILKMVMQLQELDLNSLPVLQDQMIGVDAAYFAQVLERLREKDKDRVDSSYLMTIIDRIF